MAQTRRSSNVRRLLRHARWSSGVAPGHLECGSASGTTTALTIGPAQALSHRSSASIHATNRTISSSCSRRLGGPCQPCFAALRIFLRKTSGLTATRRRLLGAHGKDEVFPVKKRRAKRIMGNSQAVSRPCEGCNKGIDAAIRRKLPTKHLCRSALFSGAEGVGLEPTSPFGQRFSSPLTALSRNVDGTLCSTILAGRNGCCDLHGFPTSAGSFRTSDGL
jgi:hypothetical protein